MLQIIIENEYGQRLDFSKNGDYFAKITGITPSGATINTSKLATTDGEKYNSATLNLRNIVLYIFPRNNIAQSRINLYKYIQPKKYIKLYLKNNYRDVWIEGRVETLDGDLYENPQQLQVSIICPDPCFKACETITSSFSSIIPKFTFPFSITSEGTIIAELNPYLEKNIYNASDHECGVIIELYARDLVLEPTIYNMSLNESFTVNHEFQIGDRVRINTQHGKKSLILIRDGVETNILNSMEKGSTWFNLQVGDNVFAYTAIEGAENLQIDIELQPIFTGV